MFVGGKKTININDNRYAEAELLTKSFAPKDCECHSGQHARHEDRALGYFVNA